MLTQVRITRFKISYFTFTFKLNEKKKTPLKNMAWREGVTRKVLLEEGLMFNRRVGNL